MVRPAAVAATTGLALLAAACSGGQSSTVAGGSSAQGSARSPSTNTEKALAYSRCMRSHRVPTFPDPNSGGTIPKVGLTQLGVGSSQFQAAQRACQEPLPNSRQSSQGQDQRVMNALWRFARCVRSRGVSIWPDPLAESDPGEPGTPGFPRNMQGVNQSSPLVRDATNTCQHLLAGIGYASGGYP